MPRTDVTQVEGFAELNQQLKRLNDRVKRTEVLRLLRKLAVPAVRAYRATLPVRTGNLQRSVGVRTVPARRSGGNPAIAVRPGRRGRNDGYYMFMVVPKGTRLSGRGRGSRKGKNTVVPVARDKALRGIENRSVREAEVNTAAFVQRQIDRLSRS